MSRNKQKTFILTNLSVCRSSLAFICEGFKVRGVFTVPKVEFVVQMGDLPSVG